MPVLRESICVGTTINDARLVDLREELLHQDNLLALSALLSVAGNDTRLKLLYLLGREREICVCDLARILSMTNSAVSQHLRKLKDKKVVKTRREAQIIYYSLHTTKFTDCVTRMLQGEFSHQE